MKKIDKAAKQFIKDLAAEIFGEDIDNLEERVVRKSKNKYMELVSAFEDNEMGNQITRI